MFEKAYRHPIFNAHKRHIIEQSCLLPSHNTNTNQDKKKIIISTAQIRDGQYGFSNLKGKYCGNKFPDEIFSSDRYLWLRFHSDDNIEYDGFEGVYEEIPRSSKTGKVTLTFSK